MPGLKVVTPYDAEDCRGLLKSAIRDPNPIVFLENELMYGVEFEVSDDVMDPEYLIPLGKAKIMTEGTDITIVSQSKQVGYCVEAAAILADKGISAEVINLRTVRPLDRDTIIESVKKTGRVITVEEGYPQCGIGSEILALCVESEVFDYLDAPPARLTAADIPLPYAAHLEVLCLPAVADIVEIAEKTCSRPGK